MAQRLRITRTGASDLQPPLWDGRPLWERHGAIVAFIRRHLPALSASAIAEPERSADGHFIEWYCDLPGQPLPLSALDPTSRARATRLLADRLSGLRDLAGRHPDDPAAALLAKAAVAPPESAIYVVNGQPVIIGWGRAGAAPTPPPAAAPIPAAPAAPVVAAVPPAAVAAASVTGITVRAVALPPVRSGFPWGLAAGLALLLLLVGLGGWLWSSGRVPALPGIGPWIAAALPGGDEEARLNAEIAAAEAELRQRLAHCPSARDSTGPAALLAGTATPDGRRPGCG